MLFASEDWSKVTKEESTFFVRVDLISVEYLLKFLAIDFISVISFFSENVFLEMIAGIFYFYSFFNYWPCFLRFLCTQQLILNNTVSLDVSLFLQKDFMISSFQKFLIQVFLTFETLFNFTRYLSAFSLSSFLE